MEREASKKPGYISKSVKFKDEEGKEEEMNSEDDEFYDSDAMVYDSEEEEHLEKLHREEEQKFMMNGKQAGIVQAPEAGYDANEEVKKVQKYKAAPGVKFVEYDEYGMNKKEGLGKLVT